MLEGFVFIVCCAALGVLIGTTSWGQQAIAWLRNRKGEQP